MAHGVINISTPRICFQVVSVSSFRAHISLDDFCSTNLVQVRNDTSDFLMDVHYDDRVANTPRDSS